MITEDLQNLYQTYLGEVPEEIVELPSSGSNRRYFRLTGTQKLIGVYGTAKEENEAFLYMAAPGDSVELISRQYKVLVVSIFPSHLNTDWISTFPHS